MRYCAIICFLLMMCAANTFAQDALYTTSGVKIKGRVIEINLVDIKYKDQNNPDGPTYVISKNDVVLIQYQNGSTEVINDNPKTIAPKATPTVNTITTETVAVKPTFDKNDPYGKKAKKGKEDFNLYYLNQNMLSINALALANGDITIMYDRDLLKSKLALTFLAGYNFNPRMGGLNLLIADSRDGAKKKYDVGIGVNFMPRNTRRVQYFVGFLSKYMAYNYQRVVSISNNQKNYEAAQGYQLGLLFTNGWVFRVTPNFNFKLFGGIGAHINSTTLKSNYGSVPKAYLGYCFGYRF